MSITPNPTGQLGVRPATGILSADNRNVPGSWVVTFTPGEDLPAIDVEVWHIAVKGPPGNFDVYIDDAFYSTAVRSDRNEYDPKHPMYVRRGQTITFHFSSADTPAPQVWLYLRQPRGSYA